MAYIQERVTKAGKKHYRVQVRLKGKPTQSATFARKTDARRWAQQTEAAIREGRHFKTAESKRRTLGDLVDRYIEQVLPQKPKSEAKQRAQLLWWKQKIGDFSLADLTPSLLVQCRDRLRTEKTARGRTRAAATVVRYMAALSHAFSIAVREWEWLEVNPMSRVSRPKEPRGRVRFLDDVERERLLTSCRDSDDRNLYPAVVLALATGMRRGEILNLKWSDVDLDVGRIILHETKNDERRQVPLTGHALVTLSQHASVRRLDCDFVFPAASTSEPARIRSAWARAVSIAQLDDFRFHDLRHSAASYLAMNGATLAEIAEVLGHKTLQMVKRYAHLSDAHTARVVASMNDKIFASSL
ncbi:MAG: site-specific integrase [Myxococcota bacterium]